MTHPTTDAELIARARNMAAAHSKEGNNATCGQLLRDMADRLASRAPAAVPDGKALMEKLIYLAFFLIGLNIGFLWF